MIHAQNVKRVVLWSPGQSAATNNTEVRFFDTQEGGVKHHYAQVFVNGPTKNGTQASVLTSLRLVEASVSTSTAASDWTNITEFVGTTSTTLGTNAFTIVGPTATGTIGKGFAFNVDLRHRERYIGVVVTGADATAQQVYADAILFRADQTPASQSDVVVNG